MCGTKLHKGSKPFQASALLLIKGSLLRSRNLFSERSLFSVVYHRACFGDPSDR
jgi:hypothetical protein